MRTEKNVYPEVFYQVGDLEVPLVRLSSMISELAPVVLYLRYVLRPGHQLIIEEPEAHLHPRSQRAFANALAALQVEGNVNVLITTHSDYLLTEINNFIRAGLIAAVDNGMATPEQMESLPGKTALALEDVSAYLFTPDGDSGTNVQQLEVSGIDGIPDEEFARVAEAMYDEAVGLQYRLVGADELES